MSRGDYTRSWRQVLLTIGGAAALALIGPAASPAPAAQPADVAAEKQWHRCNDISGHSVRRASGSRRSNSACTTFTETSLAVRYRSPVLGSVASRRQERKVPAIVPVY
jgi:hypothetical protein